MIPAVKDIIKTVNEGVPNMFAHITLREKGYSATIERYFNQPRSEVWSWLTDNDKIPLWFPELRVDTLRDGGLIKFNLGNGQFEEMVIIDFVENEVLEYTWGDDFVRFELVDYRGGCKLIFTEKMKVITEHTAKDLAGWHVCLDVISALIEGKSINRKNEWEKWFSHYVEELQHFAS